MKTSWLTRCVQVLLAVVIVGCSAAPTATPVPVREVTPLPTIEQAPATSVAAAPTLAPASPTVRPTETAVPTPLPPQPPQLLGHTPDRGEELRPDAPIVLRFDQPMDKGSVEQALTIAPDEAGAVSWPDPATLSIAPPPGGYERDSAYRVTVAEGALSAQGLALAQPIELLVNTVGYLEVAGVFPAPNSQDVSTRDTQIRVVFNRPVVPLTDITAQGKLPDPLTFAPAIAGQGEWINTSIYSFAPSDLLTPGTEYLAQVAAGLEDATGGILQGDYAWRFVTELPNVIAMSPTDGTPFVAPDAAISVTFNQPMQPAQTQALLTLTPQGGRTAVTGRYSWDKETLTLRPTSPLQRGVTYIARLAEGALAANGKVAMSSGIEWHFTVAPVPEIVSVRPADKATNVDQGEGIQIRFSSPISETTFTEALTITPPVSLNAWFSDEGTQANIYAWLRPSTTYTVTVKAGVVGIHGGTLAQARTFSFRTAPVQPYINLSVPGTIGTYNAYAATPLAVQYVNVSRVDLALYRVTAGDIVAMQGDFWSAWQRFKPNANSLVRRWSEKSTAGLDRRGTLQLELSHADGSALAPGYYYIEGSAPEARSAQRHLLVVSKLNLVLKSSYGDALIWATDLQSGSPVPNLKLDVYGAKGRVVDTVTTDKDGVAKATLPGQELWEPVTVLSANASIVAAVSRDWSAGLDPWAFNLSMEPSKPGYRAHFYTDRQLYRPGQKVYFKGIVRMDDDAQYTLPQEGTRVYLAVNDSQGRQIWKDTLALSALGSVDGSIQLGPEAATGYYRLQVSVGTPLEDGMWSNLGADFQVAEYRKPEFAVTVTTDQSDYLHGDTIVAQAEAVYYFGGPVANANVRWHVTRSGYYFDRWQGKGWYAWQDMDLGEDNYQLYGQEFLTEGEGRTDAQGRFEFEVPADLAKRKNSQHYTIEVAVTDADNQLVAASASAIVHKGDFYIGLTTDQYVGTAGQPLRVQMVTVDTQGITRTQQALQVVFSKYEWFSVQEKGEDGSFYWTNKISQTPVATETVRTDTRGWATASFTPKEGGTYKVLATGMDTYENTVQSALYLWVSGAGYISWGQENNERIELVADKKEYRPGDVAKILVPSPFQEPVKALLTIERGHVLEHRVIELKTNSEQLAIPIEAAYAPNIYVSVVLFKGMSGASGVPGLRLGYVALPVSTERQELTVTLTPNQKTPYKPRGQATYTVLVQDYQGKGVEAEVSLQLVDLALQALAGGSGPRILDTFYRERGLGIYTAATLALSADRQTAEVAKEAKGGGGGDGGDGMVRENFPDTAYWAAAVRTDASGRAQVTVDLPDNLTTWRMTAQAATADTRVGDGQVDIMTNLDVMVRPVTPRFLTVGDRPTLGAVVHNNTSGSLEMTVSLAAEGVTVPESQQTVAVPAGGRETVSWAAEVQPATQAKLQFSTRGGAYSDTVARTLPIYHASYPEIVGTSGEVDLRRSEVVRLPSNVDPTLGNLTVVIEPSLAASMRGGLEFVRSYPYECIEQTVSRFLPNLAVYYAWEQLDIERPYWDVQLPQQIGVALQRVYALQNLDGGWGWWANGDSSPELTAYVVYGLSQALKGDFSVDQGVLDRGVSFLYRWLDEKGVDTPASRDMRASVLYALAEAGQGDLGRTVALYDRRAGMALYARAYLAMTLQMLDPTETTRTVALANEMANAALLSATGAHWEEEVRNPWAMNTDTRTTAMVLRALVRIQPDNKLLPNAVRWLMTARRSGRWETTQENVWSILALTDVMVASGELGGEYTVSLDVAGKDIGQVDVSPANIDKTYQAVIPVSQLHREVGNLVTIERSALKGKLYYSAYLRYYLPAEEVKALDRGIVISRQYALASDPKKPITRATVNDTLIVKLTIIAPNDLHFMVLEDPLPAGCEPVDTSLATTSRTATYPQLTAEAQEEWKRWSWYRWWPTHSELRDEKVALFADYLGRGTYEYTYMVRCTTPGRYQALPATAYEMYAADVYGRSAGGVLEISPAR
jgi:hypothetical protein